MEKLLEYQSVEICFHGQRVICDMSFALHPGEILGVVGESGSGKSTLLRAAVGLLGNGGRVTRGDIRFRGRSLPDLSEREMRAVRGAQIGMIFQNAEAALCPVRTIGAQICESLRAHADITRGEARERALALFAALRFQDGQRVWNSYPFELSGGMNQRVSIAMAMLQEPLVLLADEPTSALDMLAQKQTAQELLLLRRLLGTAILLVTHDLGLVSAMADTVLVLQDGRSVEYGPVRQVLQTPRTDYVRGLLDAVPRLRRG